MVEKLVTGAAIDVGHDARGRAERVGGRNGAQYNGGNGMMSVDPALSWIQASGLP
ncbi:hypothetical protein [Hyphomicrobium sulfonivorans]|uniref:hypothetical protein n=1 Tax=Hyphomicrobium sulfonivorans TaxID=121290 RepID=UPI0018E1253A|nr:hypothetical protein [Hyphomicrobium sulfonivorans]MBI1649448.1 hypothetical protein [Hyphomicrobium sulfonivorans]